MKYYYQTAGGATAGPETLEKLTALLAAGEISMATMVVPAGGEDWTPLARVLRFFYADDAGVTAGPVAFSELNRLNQISALTGDAWVMEEGGTQWRALSTVLQAGGVAVTAAPAAHTSPAVAWRPPATGKTTAVNPYAAPRAPAGRTRVIHRAMGGLRRMPFFGSLLLLVVFFFGAIYFSAVVGKVRWEQGGVDGLYLFFRHLFTAFMVVSGLTVLGAIILFSLRLTNIGWSHHWLWIYLVPIVLGAMAAWNAYKPWMPPVNAIFVLAGMIFFIALCALPPGYSRHRRLDPAAWTVVLILVLLYAALVVVAMMNTSNRA
jgi:hypothetical protein